MSGLFKRPNLGQTEPAIGDLDVQTSAYGLAVGVTYGRNRVPLQLLWYGDFKATPQEERQEVGKGGTPPSRTFYIYSASILASVGEGPIVGVRRIWKGKQKFAAVESGTIKLSKSETHNTGGSPYQVTVDSAATWESDLGVTLRGQEDGNWEVDRPLRAGLDYTVAAGVYTFDSSLTNRVVIIRYATTEVTPAETALQSLGMTLVPIGGADAGVWSHLSNNHAAQAVPYAGLAYIHAQDYPLSDYARVENHLVEIDGRLQSELGYPDANHADVWLDILGNPAYGVGFPGSMIEAPDAWREFVDAASIWVSPAYLAQKPAREHLQELLDVGFAKAVWTGSKLRVIPVWDDVQGAYTPDTTPVFDLGPDDYVGRPEVERKGVAEAENQIRVEFTNRNQDYQTQVVTWRDESLEVAFGPKAGSARSYHLLPLPNVANRVAAMIGQQQITQGDRFTFRLPGHYLELQPGDLVTLTDPAQGLDRETVMVERIAEAEVDGAPGFEVEGFSFPIGVANAPVIAPPVGSGYIPDWNEAAGSANEPAIIEPPGGFVTGGLEVWVAASGGAQWGGCDVYASLDGASYKQVGTINQHCRHGTVVSITGTGDSAILTVQLANNSVQLRSVSEQDAQAGRTLCLVGSVADGEYLSYRTATLVAPGRYELGGLVRAQHGTNEVTPEEGDQFVLLDQSLATSGALDIDAIGKTLSIKLVSFNRYGGGLESLANVSVYQHVITGRFRDQKGVPFVANLLTNPGFEHDLSDWAMSPASQSFATKMRGHIDPVNRIVGVPGNATISQSGRVAGSSIRAATLTSKAIQVDPTKELFLSAKLLPVNCKAGVELLYAPASGDFGAVGGGVEVFFPDVAAVSDSGDPSDYVAIQKRIKPLHTARYAALRIVKYDSASDAASLLRILEPFLGAGPRGLPESPSWNSGTKSTTNTAGIAPGAVEGSLVFRLNGPITTNSNAFVNVLSMLKTYGVDDPAEQWIVTVNIDATIQQGATQTLISVQANCGGQDATVVAAHSIGNGNSIRGSTSFTVDLGTQVGPGAIVHPVSVRIDGASDASATINSCSAFVRLKRR